MYMPYTQNPHVPRIRMDAVRLIRKGWSTRRVARYTGFNQSTIVRWTARAPENRRAQVIPTESSRPHHHPLELSDELVEKVIQYRMEHDRCAEVIHHLLEEDGYCLSLSSVKRIFRRYGLIKARSPWKKWHTSSPRPEAKSPGILVQIDTIHIGQYDPWYVYTMLDVYSRWAHAVVANRINTHLSLRFVREAQEIYPVRFKTLQSDHGQEFSSWFTKRIEQAGYVHRHSRVRRPTDNGHLERFNRTLQEECLRRCSQTPAAYRKALPEYLVYYRTKRPHLGLGMKTPEQVMRSY